jgi:hypothetical protein
MSKKAALNALAEKLRTMVAKPALQDDRSLPVVQPPSAPPAAASPSRRKFMKDAGASALSGVMDATPVGALTKLVADDKQLASVMQSQPSSTLPAGWDPVDKLGAAMFRDLASDPTSRLTSTQRADAMRTAEAVEAANERARAQAIESFNAGRRKFIKDAGATVASHSLDASPVGALTKLATNPALVESVVKVAPQRLTQLDRTVADSLWWLMHENDEFTKAAPAVQQLFLTEVLDGLAGNVSKKKLAELRERVTSLASPTATGKSKRKLHDTPTPTEELLDELQGLSVPPEVLYRAGNKHLYDWGKRTPEDNRAFIDDVIEESWDSDRMPSKKDIERTYRRIFGDE